ncbi:hypothetical protein PNEG_01979 [Pneumocystis murina B123]|uniref:SET domain-containing protein n=1 Tax=Pneumocystis murina (strain B123) TaxID=1069680 RepID=M7NRC2_PNEMU|nr:hypothetical protein PNEG_01979 [Pneumocystis murina B123]EMR09797.1 hypothetical protein PNEG_01979 [Pneumocystis murina B123]
MGLESVGYDLDAGIIRCICGLEDDDGFTIQCERCYVWQHAVCVGIDQHHVPDEYLCDLCFPRTLDVKKAIEKQRRRREQELVHVKTNSSHSRKRRQFQYGLVKSKVHSLGSVKEKSLNATVKHDGSRKSRSGGRTFFSKDMESRFQIMEGSNGLNMNSDLLFDCNTEYSVIEHNLISSVDAEMYISLLLQDKSGMHVVLDDYFTSKQLPKTSIQPISDTDISSFLRFSLYSNQFIASGQIIKEFKGEIYLQDEYKVNSINHYSFLLAPKPFVYFVSDSKLCIDTRKYGTDSRFIRRSCKPNAKLITVASSSNFLIHIALCSLTEIQSGSEITIGWDWDMDHPAYYIENRERVPENDVKYSQELIYYINGLECACEIGKDCILFRLKQAFSSISKSSIKSNKKKAIFPLNNINHDIDNYDPDKSISQLKNDTNVVNKLRNVNEISESFVKNPSSCTDSNSNDLLSAREERKIKDILARIEKLEQEETQVIKKRKRGNGKSNENHKTYGHQHRTSLAVAIKQVCQQSGSSTTPSSSPKNDVSNTKSFPRRHGRIPSRIVRMQKHGKITNGILKDYSDDNDILPCKKMWMRRWIQENFKFDVEKVIKKDKQRLENGVVGFQDSVCSKTFKDMGINSVKCESRSSLSDMVLLEQLLPDMESSDKLSLSFTSPEPAISVPISEPSQLSDKLSTPSLFKPDLGFSSASESHMSSFTTIASPLTSELEPIQSTVLLTSPTSILGSFPKKISLSEYKKRRTANEELVVNDKSDDTFNIPEISVLPNNNSDFKIENSENTLF